MAAFAGDVDLHFFIIYEWPAGVSLVENSDFAEGSRLQIAEKGISTQASFKALVHTLCGSG